MTVDVQPLFSGALDTQQWRRRHADGRVPDAYPYGLHRLAAHGFDVREASALAGPAAVRLGRGAVRRLAGGYDWVGAALLRPDADVVLSWDERLGVPAARRWGGDVPVVTNVIWTTESTPPPHVRSAVTTGLRAARRVFVHSSGQVPVLRDRFGVDERRVRAVRFGVDQGFFRPAPTEEVDRDLVVSVGNDRHRDFGTVLRAFAELRRARPAARLVVVSATLDAGAQRQDGVRVIAGLDHAALRDLVARASLTLTLTHPNTHVSGATAVLESLATGRPAVATANPGMHDYADPDGGLVLVPPGDHVAAAAACAELLADPDAADGRGRAGRAAVEQELNTERHAERLAGVLRDAVA